MTSKIIEIRARSFDGKGAAEIAQEAFAGVAFPLKATLQNRLWFDTSYHKVPRMAADGSAGAAVQVQFPDISALTHVIRTAQSLAEMYDPERPSLSIIIEAKESADETEAAESVEVEEAEEETEEVEETATVAPATTGKKRGRKPKNK